MPPAPNASTSLAGAAAAVGQSPQPSPTSGKPPTSRAPVECLCAPTPAPAVVLPNMVSHVAFPAAVPQPQLASDEDNALADVNGWPSPRAHRLRSALARRELSAWRRPSLEPPASLSDPRRLPPGLPCTVAPSRSTPSCAGVSGINRDTCLASAEPTTGITRDAFVVLQPDQHINSGARGGNRTPDLDVRTVLLYPLSYAGSG